MVPISPARAEVLRAIHHLTSEFRRPPIPAEVAHRMGKSTSTVWHMVQRAVADGQAVIGSRLSMYTPGTVRLTPAALAALGIPALVYLAWPMDWSDPTSELDADYGADHASRLARLGIAAVSPCLAPSSGNGPGVRAAAEALARVADAAVVVADGLLVGRSDVTSARLASVPIAVIDDLTGVTSAAELWVPPRLVPAWRHGRNPADR